MSRAGSSRRWILLAILTAQPISAAPTAPAFLPGPAAPPGVVSSGASVRQEPAAELPPPVELPGDAPLPTMIHLPLDYDPARAYPLVLALHGFGGSEETFTFLAPLFQYSGVILAAPRGPYEFFAEGQVRYEWLQRNTGDAEIMREATAASVAAVGELADLLGETYLVSETFLLGFSQGGTMSFLVGLGSDEVAGIATFGSRLVPERVDAEVLRARPYPPVYIAHGLADRIPMASVIAGRDFLLRLGFEVTFRSFSGAHEIPPPEAKRALDWMLAQGRDER